MFQFRMIAHSKWHMAFDTSKHHSSSNIEDLSYDATILEGIKCKFSLTSEGLHVYKIRSRNRNNIFSNKTTDNVTMFGGKCHALIEDQDKEGVDVSKGTNVDNYADLSNNVDNSSNNVQSTKDSKVPGVELVDKKVRFADKVAIDSMSHSRDRFSKRDQVAANRVRR